MKKLLLLSIVFVVGCNQETKKEIIQVVPPIVVKPCPIHPQHIIDSLCPKECEVELVKEGEWAVTMADGDTTFFIHYGVTYDSVFNSHTDSSSYYIHIISDKAMRKELLNRPKTLKYKIKKTQL